MEISINKTIEKLREWQTLLRRFDSRAYLAQNPDVKNSGMNALRHYLKFGRFEGRSAPLKTSALVSGVGKSSDLDIPSVQGRLETSEEHTRVVGWMAAIGDEKPRRARVVFADREITVSASQFRQDLLHNGINQGFHGFSVSVPTDLIDGAKHRIRLIDDATGVEVARAEQGWVPPRRPYEDLEGFLAYSMTQPVISAPFKENDKRVFAATEALANRLAKRGVSEESPPLVSIILPVFNREELVGKAIKSVLSQSYRRFELLIVDDGSEDGSLRVARSFQDDRIKILELGRNVGPAKARNTAYVEAKGEIVAYLDSDNTWDDRYLAATVGIYLSRENTDAVISGRYIFRGEEDFASSVCFGHLNIGLLENRNYLDINCLSHRRELFLDEPPFDETLTRFLDYDLCLRLASRRQLVSCPLLLCNYFENRASNTLSAGANFEGDFRTITDNYAKRVNSRRRTDALLPLQQNVTVVIPSWEAQEDIETCIRALVANDWAGRLEIVIVDNASSPQVRKYLREAAHQHPEVRLVENDTNYGFTYAVNQGIAAAYLPTSDILLLNNDAIVLPGAIQTLQKAAYTLDQAGITLPRQILPPETPTIQTHVPYADVHREMDVNISQHHQNAINLGPFHDGGPTELRFGPFFAAYIRRDVIEDVGLLDPEHGRHYRSDRVYCDLVRLSGRRKIYHVPDAHVVHKLQSSTGELRRQHDETMYENMFRKNWWSEPEMRTLGYVRRPWDQ